MLKRVGVAGLAAVLALAMACEGDDKVDEPGSPADDRKAASSAATGTGLTNASELVNEPPAGPPDDRKPGSSTAMGPGLSIAEAKASELDGPLLVNGFIVAVGRDVKLCSALLESLPPQCGGESLRVVGLDLSSLDGTQAAGNTTWTSDLVQLLGEVDGEMLTVTGMSVG